ncbi:hypothetical protein [Sandarakinorhabdus sp.]|uniref:hypothetical protein n=1 Tax=Sandarakinorhabdus sp. TaxID=1916663 RepID=UPI00286E8F65|nr:hypothetical protein [Sandarakinorhabdus sp.]
MQVGQGASQGEVPPLPPVCLTLGVTGHRDGNAALQAGRAGVAAVLDQIFGAIDDAVAAAVLPAGAGSLAPTRLHSLLADGVDQMAADAALARGWQLVAPLPFGADLNIAVGVQPCGPEDTRLLLSGEAARDPEVAARAARIRALYARSRCFALADRDDEVRARLLEMISHPGDVDLAVGFAARASERVALAGRVLIQQSDIIIGVWDGASEAFVGGTGHTIAAALDMGAAVIRIDPASPGDWHILRSPEALVSPVPHGDRMVQLQGLVAEALGVQHEQDTGFRAGIAALMQQPWPGQSHLAFHGYRRVEAMFDGTGRPLRSLHQTYVTPDAFVAGAGAPVLAAAATIPGGDAVITASIAAKVMRRHAFADGIAANLSDSYRGGMIANFMLSGLAVVTGIAYQPIATIADKWMFALCEFAMLAAILVITWAGQKRRWHGRWFETRRVAEYFRHAPALLLLGVARPPGRWPRGADTSWPEMHARHGLRELGLPAVHVTPAYLRAGLTILHQSHVAAQRQYHRDKAERLSQVQRRLDRLSSRSFQLAVVAVSCFLIFAGLEALGLIATPLLDKLAKIFTFLGVLLPTFGGTVAGIRYFGDFERFAAISEVTAEKLDSLDARIALLLSGPDIALDYGRVAELAHAADDIVVSEIENWQAVFGGKHITVPV